MYSEAFEIQSKNRNFLYNTNRITQLQLQSQINSQALQYIQLPNYLFNDNSSNNTIDNVIIDNELKLNEIIQFFRFSYEIDNENQTNQTNQSLKTKTNGLNDSNASNDSNEVQFITALDSEWCAEFFNTTNYTIKETGSCILQVRFFIYIFEVIFIIFASIVYCLLFIVCII